MSNGVKIFLTWTGANDPDTINSILKLNKQPNKIVYWIGGPGTEKYVPPEIVFHNIFDATRGKPAKGINPSEFSPPGKDLIERLYKVESIILSMMNRRSHGLHTDERKDLYYDMLRYWHGILKKYAPDIIINPSIPHDVCSYLVYELAHLLNIKTIVMHEMGLSDRLLTYRNFWEESDDLYEELKKNKDKNFSLKDLSEDLQKYYELQTNPKYDALPIDIEIMKDENSGFSLFLRRLRRLKNSIKKGTILDVVKQSINRRIKQNLKKEYNSIQVKPDFNKKFIYAPLHEQPECATSPLGDMFDNQILMIEILSASLPDDWVIYVKEHPTQWIRRGVSFSCYRYQGYYKKIAELKNVQLVPADISGHNLINKSQAVAVITGRTGWEAVLRGKPAIVFGYPWYKNCSEIFRVKDVKSCKEALKKIVNGFTVSQQKIINYLKCFDNATIHGYLNPNLKKNSKLTKQESLNNIIQKILSEIHDK